MARIRMPTPETMSTEQAAACAEAVQGRRGKVPLPMVGWLSSPELARRVQKVGEFLRFETSLGPALTELAILVCARRWTAHVEWKAHKELALKAGLDPQIIAAVLERREPAFDDPRAREVHALAQELLARGRLGDDHYARAVAHLGERGVAEVIALMGYYTLVSFTLNTFELGLPENAVAELGDPEFPGTAA